MERTNIPVSKSTRKRLRVLKAAEEHRSYDDLLQSMVDEYREGRQ